MWTDCISIQRGSSLIVSHNHSGLIWSSVRKLLHTTDCQNSKTFRLIKVGDFLILFSGYNLAGSYVLLLLFVWWSFCLISILDLTLLTWEKIPLSAFIISIFAPWSRRAWKQGYVPQTQMQVVLFCMTTSNLQPIMLHAVFHQASWITNHSTDQVEWTVPFPPFVATDHQGSGSAPCNG